MKRMLALVLALALLPLFPALGEETLPEPDVSTREMLLGEATAEYFYEATLYYTGSDGVSLSQATRTLLVQTGETLLDVVLEALLDSSLSPAQVSVIPGDTRVISREISGGLVTVNLSIEARNVQSDQELLLIYLAISGTLLEMEGVEGVSVLINDREEGVLGLPGGVFSAIEGDVAAAWAQMQAEADRYLGNAQGSATRVAALYFPSADGRWLVPETREISFTEDTIADELLSQLCAGPQVLECGLSIAPTGTLLAGEPVLAVTSAGERVLELNLDGAALAAAESAGVQRWQVCGALTLTLCSFLTELDAVRLSVDGESITQAQREGTTFSFEEDGMRRRDFSGFIGSAASLYLANEDGELILRETALSQGEALAARALLSVLMSEEMAASLGGVSPVPALIDETDILGVRVRDGVATVNLSARFYSACQELDEARERTAVYAIVNTLCGLSGVEGVRFLIEGESVETLSEYIYMRTVLLPNPGAVVTE